jgi:hypothetical protein
MEDWYRQVKYCVYRAVRLWKGVALGVEEIRCLERELLEGLAGVKRGREPVAAF